MNLNQVFAISFSLAQLTAIAQETPYKLDFGVVIHNEDGEPVGFEKTKQIPILHNGENSLFGLVVTSPKDQQFMLNSVHSLPSTIQRSNTNKIMGKPMWVKYRGAIFLRTNATDEPGLYTMEVYIDNELHTIIEYELTSSHQLTRL